LGENSDEAVVKAKELLGDFEQLTYKETGIKLDEYTASLKKFNAAFELMQNRQWEKAIAGYKEVIIINPKGTQSFGNMALCYAHLNENQKAIEAFDRAIALDPNYEPAIINKEIFKGTIAKGLTFSETQSEIKVIEYMKDYPLEDNNRLVDDYLNGKMNK